MNGCACLLPVSARHTQHNSPLQALLLWQPGHRKHLGLRATQDPVEEGAQETGPQGGARVPQISRHYGWA